MCTSKTTSITFSKPAENWDEALPIGNGRLGAMIYGTVGTEVFQLNDDSVWYGGPRDRINPSALENLPEIRRLINEGQISAAENLCALALTGLPESQRHYEPLANLYIIDDFKNTIVDYHRALDMTRAVVTSTYKTSCNCEPGSVATTGTACASGEATTGSTAVAAITREAFSSNPKSAIIIRLTSSERTLNFHTALGRGNITWDLRSTEEQVYRHPAYADFCDRVYNIGNTTILTGLPGGEGAIRFACGIRVIYTDGTLKSIGNSLVIKDASEVVIAVTSATSFYEQNEDLESVITNRLKALDNISYEELLNEHVTDHANLFNRVSLTLPESEDDIVRLFNFGRYLMIAGSREGSQPLNLQGIWNKDLNPMWGSKYTININAQMNYWPAEICNLSECHSPLFELIERMRPNGREVARKMYGCGGFMAHHNTDIWGDCAPQDMCLSSTYWVMGAAWLSLHLWTHYEYTLDTDFLQTKFPTMLEAAEFILDYLTEDGDHLVTNPTLSPENEYILPNGNRGVICKGATMDNQIIRELFGACLKAANILKIENATLDRISLALPRIAPTAIGADGTIKEWNEDYPSTDPGHRHISHLFGLYPGNEINETTPQLKSAAFKTIEKRLSNGGAHTGWSRAWIINLYARLRDGNEAHQHIRLLISKSLLPNLFDNHPPFQIDGNFGVTSGIAEMLVQNDSAGADDFTLLPALPDAWDHGEVKGLRLKGNRTVDITWKDHKVTDFRVY